MFDKYKLNFAGLSILATLLIASLSVVLFISLAVHIVCCVKLTRRQRQDKSAKPLHTAAPPSTQQQSQVIPVYEEVALAYVDMDLLTPVRHQIRRLVASADNGAEGLTIAENEPERLIQEREKSPGMTPPENAMQYLSHEGSRRGSIS